ncbi:phage portal protein [Paraburkholderia panacisoli]|jgi:capsid protein|uniref:Phage portal protein n=1 Tax=Paraburkholderia panacisoli TaxID=2603818 RepID=A0A5B0HKR3_9BURK|nr:phage portal protein [Paraburkholderia panacisoli]KAA1015828.1 phage portal protein [Paraburkholderia panacisoli]
MASHPGAGAAAYESIRNARISSRTRLVRVFAFLGHPALVEDALGAGDGEELPLYQALRAQWADEPPPMLNGARTATLAPGESIESVSATHVHGNSETFAHEMRRMIAAVLGLSAEQLAQEWSKTNGSSARRRARSVENAGAAA